ncbi:phage protein [Streptococcus dysgalactiae subsp. dysgalactiae]|uniref:Phage protein n=1 Tax=Streptococcus dysgalactiae subsp. dysgalactiae TaxID=99822 RepID=A0A380JS20_STRDY|nr:YopX family protein [Streptococcus dysgalactiae]SUN47685.1 phage protein [Streptococcus dysgalactiae subsp. dysgalactiae]
MKPKFRVWDKEKQAMSTVEAIDYVNDKIYPFYRKYVRRYIPFEEAVLMQSTGLFDKNGVKIFDGDIVKLQYTIASDFELFEVRQFRGGMWRIDNRRRGSDLWLRNEDCEVIGNIHENPDLLESVEE